MLVYKEPTYERIDRALRSRPDQTDPVMCAGQTRRKAQFIRHGQLEVIFNTMVKLVCKLVNMQGGSFRVNIDAADDIMDWKDAIKAKNEDIACAVRLGSCIRPSQATTGYVTL